MNKNIIIGILVLALLAETGYLFVSNRSSSGQKGIATTAKPGSSIAPSLPPAGPNARGKGPIIISKGAYLKNTPIFQYAYQIYPGALSDSAKKMVGWNINSKPQSNGLTVVSLTPKDSKDQSQQYTLKQGQTLYFIEQTPTDDNLTTDKDLNYRDDYGIIVDQNGIVQ